MSKKILILTIGTLFLVLLTNGQKNRNTYITEQKKIRDEIKKANLLLKKAGEKRSYSLNQLKLIDHKVRQREELISLLNEEVKNFDREIELNENKKQNLEADLVKEKKAYAEIIYKSYLNYNDYQILMFFLASDNINQMYTRYKYMEQYTSMRKKRILLIDALTKEIDITIEELENLRKEKIDAINNVFHERNELNKEKGKRKRNIASLKNEEKKLKDEIKRNEQLQKELAKKIEEIIKNEQKKSGNIKLTPQEKLISGNFEKNKGRLPWPTVHGIITAKFGEQWHPVVKKIKTQNIGIDISTNENSIARSVYNGKVIGIYRITGANYTVIVKHGEYYSVYHNLKSVHVKQGNEIGIKDTIGEVFTNGNTNSTVLHFEILKGKDYLNPEDWLSN